MTSFLAGRWCALRWTIAPRSRMAIETKATCRRRSSGLVDSFHDLRGSMSVPACDTRSISARGLCNGNALAGAQRHHFRLIWNVTSGRLYRDTVPDHISSHLVLHHKCISMSHWSVWFSSNWISACHHIVFENCMSWQCSLLSNIHVWLMLVPNNKHSYSQLLS